jgi:hypothetical protein
MDLLRKEEGIKGVAEFLDVRGAYEERPQETTPALRSGTPPISNVSNTKPAYL